MSARSAAMDSPRPLVEGERLDQPTFHVLYFRQEQGCLVRIPTDPDGLYRSTAFPGLWLDPRALLQGDTKRLRAVLDIGLATPEHAAFVARLAATRGAT
jgi:hypothetical protein